MKIFLCGCTSYDLLFCQVVRLLLIEKRKVSAHKTKVFNSLMIIMLQIHKKISSRLCQTVLLKCNIFPGTKESFSRDQKK